MFRRFCILIVTWGMVFLGGSAVFAQPATELEALKDQADAAYRERDFPKSIQLCNQVLGQAATDHVALYLRGSSRVELGIAVGDVEQVRQGIADAREAIKQEGNGKAEYYLPYIYGMSHLAALEGKVVHAQTARTVADSVLDREDLTPAQRANLYYQRAQANMQLRDFPAAETDLGESLKLDPKHLAALMMRADLTARSKTPSEAYTAYSQVVEQFPDNPLTYNNRGMFLQSQGKVPEALADFAKAIQVDQNFIPAHINRGYALLESGDSAGAEAALTQVLTMDPKQIGAISLRGAARLNQGKTAEALADYRQVTALVPQNPMAFADLGFAQFFTQDFAGALASFNAALKIENKMRFLLPWKLACEMRLQQIDLPSYQEILAKPEESRDWVDHLLLFQLGKLDATQMLKGAGANPDTHARDAQLCEGYYFIGVELQRRSRGSDAQAYFKKAIEKPLPKLSAFRGAKIALSQP